jgi:hypothetical protein
VGEVLHDTYLPFPPDVLRRHFALSGRPGGPDHLRYYRASLARAAEHTARIAVGHRPTDAEIRAGRQIEKDERFWVVSALLGLYYAGDGAERADRFGRLLTAAGIEPADGSASWRIALGDDLRLYFEVALPAPASYKTWLRDHLSERAPIPYTREASRRPGVRLEGQTWADAMLIAPDTGVAIAFEAKVLSDVSTDNTYDVMRNQIARYLDVLMDENPRLAPPLNTRQPERSYVVLLTPELFKTAEGSRLYSFLVPAYRDPTGMLLHHHLPHRSVDAVRAAGRRLGWTSWEECNRITPGACAWLTPVCEVD